MWRKDQFLARSKRMSGDGRGKGSVGWGQCSNGVGSRIKLCFSS